VQTPEPGPGEVLIEVAVAGVNFADVGIRAGMVGGPHAVELSYTPGFEVAGVVVAIGEGAEGGAEDDRVAAVLPAGGATPSTRWRQRGRRCPFRKVWGFRRRQQGGGPGSQRSAACGFLRHDCMVFALRGASRDTLGHRNRAMARVSYGWPVLEVLSEVGRLRIVRRVLTRVCHTPNMVHVWKEEKVLISPHATRV
jgi:hypothetical protein